MRHPRLRVHPAASSFGGFRMPAASVCSTTGGPPASENLRTFSLDRRESPVANDPPAFRAQSISAAHAHGCRFGRPGSAAAPPRRRPWKRAVLAPTAAAPLSSARTLCAHEETFGLPATRRLALCDVPHISSPRRCPINGRRGSPAASR
jgi:hypothetical protein